MYAGLDIMLLNSGSIRGGLQAGNITIGDVQQVLPLVSTLSVLRMRGDVLLAVLENAVSRWSLDQAASGTGRFLCPAGMDFGFNYKQAVGERVTFANVWSNLTAGGTADNNGGERTPLSLSKWYLVGMSTFGADGGDGNTVLKNNSAAIVTLGQTFPRM